MRKEYNFSQAKKNPYAKHFKQQITIRLDRATIAYFKRLAEETGMTYQNLIDLYLKDCAQAARRPMIRWLKTMHSG